MLKAVGDNIASDINLLTSSSLNLCVGSYALIERRVSMAVVTFIYQIFS
jgi:hypothetical protein